MIEDLRDRVKDLFDEAEGAENHWEAGQAYAYENVLEIIDELIEEKYE